MSHSLINFNVPVSLKDRFDAVCHASGRTRTSVLHQLMSDYVVSQGKALAALQDEYDEVDRILRAVPAPDDDEFEAAYGIRPDQVGVYRRAKSEFPEFEPEDFFGPDDW